ncbi:MAG: hypothetical protein J0H74_22040 [Chitinophagaceae bacterium]|nr:hypothetical protein [Chitinophagaceae bacterium]
MKYNPGDGISIQIDSHQFLSGIVLAGHAEQGRKYPIVLTGSIHNDKPPIEWFYACDLFAVEYGVKDESVFMLDTVLMDVDYVDGLPEIELVTRLPFEGLVSKDGFYDIADMLSLKDYYTAEIQLRKEPGFSAGDVFNRKCFRSIQDVLAAMVPPNEFPTVKLFKTWDGDVFYWQLFRYPGDTFHLVVNEGMLGGSDRVSELKTLIKEEAHVAYDELIRGKKMEGYQEAAGWERMTLQFQTNDAWGGAEDLDFRNEMWEYLDDRLYWSGNGAFSGGDIGSGTINLFFEVISPTVAVETIVKALAEKQVDRPYIIVHEVPKEGERTAFNVVYPREYKLTFHY